MELGSGEVSGNSTLASSMNDGSVPTGLEYDLDTTIGLYSSHVGVKSIFAGLLTLTIYEMIITFDSGVNLFYKQRWNMHKALFILNQIFATFILCVLAIGGLFAVSTDTYCRAAPWIAFVGSNVLLLIVNLSLIIRVTALWKQKPLVLYFARAFFLLNYLTQLTVQPYIIVTAIAKAYKPPFTGCEVTITFEHTYIIFLTGILFETCMVALTIARSYPIARASRDGTLRSPLWTLLLQDGILYYASIIGVQVFTVVLSKLPQNNKHSVPAILSYLPFVVPGIACNRLFIRLQTALLIKEGTIMETSHAISSGGDTGESELTVIPYGARRRHRKSLSTNLYIP